MGIARSATGPTWLRKSQVQDCGMSADLEKPLLATAQPAGSDDRALRGSGDHDT
jgi:hypothetical protein